jgi:microcystin-dependent protein
MTTSSASTGGNSVGSGGAVVTGDASASSKSEVTSGGDGADVRIETSTTVNGETKTQTIEKTLKAGEPVSVEVNSKALSGQKPEASIKINSEKIGATGVATVTAETIARVGGEEPKHNFVSSITTRISFAIKSIFSVLKFW